MSGGVDSSVAAYLLKQQGYEVIGLFMRSGVTEETVCAVRNPAASSASRLKQGCCSAADAADARRVADQLDIPFHALNFEEAFAPILDYFADEYLAGRTPNPCILCNNWLKFGKLWEFARQVGAERIATGHYAQLRPANGSDEPTAASGARRPALFRGRDRAKDQSYVLFGIRRELLPRLLFPVGGYTKSQIRELARQAGFRVADKPDSQEICFIPGQNYAAFIERHRGRRDTAGEIVDTAGRVVGHHDGYERFTIGQRRGLGVALGSPRFVVAIDAATKRVVIGTHEELGRRDLEADRLNWLVESLPDSFRCLAQIRYLHRAAPAQATLIDKDRLRVEFDEPQYGVAPGQAVVLYDGDQVLGGGWIR
ncbi:MAG: tRNA 2-thiouridine(34) synthase MnmA [Planctomycetes bacterium]|nr:tRNA 2-thiouridine(34) synthase MnmA [Planctomycetota bacterium]